MEVFVARHPVFDRFKNVYGYELVFRSGFEAQYSQLQSDTTAVDFLAFVDFEELADGKKGFVKFSRDLLLSELPNQLPRDTMVVCIDSQTQIDEPLVDAMIAMTDQGFLLALTGLTVESETPSLLELVNIVGVDFSNADAEAQKTFVDRMNEKNVGIWATGLNTVAQFEQAVESGATYFGGEFFTCPDTRVDDRIPGNEMAHLRVLHLAGRPDTSYDELAELIEQDVAMTYMLLKFMNSAWFGLKYEIRSVKHALVMLGPQEIRRWVSLFVVRMTGKDKPFELLLRSLTRARAAELTGLLIDMDEQASELFLLGMFSVIDALMDMPMEDILNEIPLSEDVKAALTGVQNRYRQVFDMLLAYERGDWQRFGHFTASLGLDERLVPDIFSKSLEWAHQALEGL
ncbi:MAG: EAL and HDOD domain-containing protein [Phycisphaerae bacterium]